MSQEQQLPALDFTGMDDYTPYSGGGHGDLPYEGYYAVKIDGAEPGLTKPDHQGVVKGRVKVGCMVIDDGEGHGVHLMDDVLYSGIDKNGKSLVRQFSDFLTSTGQDPLEIQQLGKQNAKRDIKQVCASLVDATAFIEVKFRLYEGKIQTEIANWVTREQYEKKKAVGAHRGRSAVQAAAMLSALNISSPTGPGRTFSAPNGSHAINLGGPQAPAFVPTL